jgi:hypothetical protein
MAPFDSAFLDAKRMRGDELADTALAAMVAEQGAAGARELFDLLIRRVETPVTELPASVHDYLSATQQLPAWADPQLIAVGQRLFLDHGPKMLVLLYYKSLPMLYSCADGAEVLARTARLTRVETDWTIFTRRVAETAQFLLGVMAPGSLAPGAEGIRLIQKVRLIHASIRFFLRADGWEGARFGVPVNQEDMAITLCSFSISLLDGLARFGVQLSPQEEEAFVHTWRAIGAVLGLDDDLLPDSPLAARELERAILNRYTRPTEAGQILTEALLQFAEARMPHETLQVAPRALIQYTLGPERAALLGIQPNYGCLAWLIPEALAAYFRTGERLEDRSAAWLSQLLDQLSRLLTRGMYQYFDRFKQRNFSVPKAFRDAWEVKSD